MDLPAFPCEKIMQFFLADVPNNQHDRQFQQLAMVSKDFMRMVSQFATMRAHVHIKEEEDEVSKQKRLQTFAQLGQAISLHLGGPVPAWEPAFTPLCSLITRLTLSDKCVLLTGWPISAFSRLNHMTVMYLLPLVGTTTILPACVTHLECVKPDEFEGGAGITSLLVKNIPRCICDSLLRSKLDFSKLHRASFYYLSGSMISVLLFNVPTLKYVRTKVLSSDANETTSKPTWKSLYVEQPFQNSPLTCLDVSSVGTFHVPRDCYIHQGPEDIKHTLHVLATSTNVSWIGPDVWALPRFACAFSALCTMLDTHQHVLDTCQFTAFHNTVRIEGITCQSLAPIFSRFTKAYIFVHNDVCDVTLRSFIEANITYSRSITFFLYTPSSIQALLKVIRDIRELKEDDSCSYLMDLSTHGFTYCTGRRMVDNLLGTIM